jgi:four helix bundle protein
MALVESVYRVSSSFPKEEVYGLTSQLRRAAVSIPANIAEGEGRGSRREFVRFLSIAHGSLREVETHVLLAQRLGYIDSRAAADAMAAAGEVGRLLNGLKKSLAPDR